MQEFRLKFNYFLSFVTFSVIVDWIHHWGKLDSNVSDNDSDDDSDAIVIVDKVRHFRLLKNKNSEEIVFI